MQMFANDPQYIVEDMLKGYAKAHSDIIEPTDNPRVYKTAQPFMTLSARQTRATALPACMATMPGTT